MGSATVDFGISFFTTVKMKTGVPLSPSSLGLVVYNGSKY